MMNLIRQKCLESQLEPSLVLALVEQESSFNSKAMRYESHFKWLLDVTKYAKALNISEDTEETLQKFSYGLFQLMGSVVRELGFKGYLTDALDVNTNIDLGIRKLQQLKSRYPKTEDWLSAYNAGSPTSRNNPYVSYILKNASQYR